MSKKGQVVCEIHGSWLEKLVVGEDCVWHIGDSEVFEVVPVSQCLPSDSRYRGDCLAMKKGNLKEAQK